MTALLWDDSGDSLFVGYASGKLLVFKFNRLKVHNLFAFSVHCTRQLLSCQVHLEATPLLECGSKVISLSYSPPNLLVSSLNRPLLVNIETGASSQVSFSLSDMCWPHLIRRLPVCVCVCVCV